VKTVVTTQGIIHRQRNVPYVEDFSLKNKPSVLTNWRKVFQLFYLENQRSLSPAERRWLSRLVLEHTRVG